MTSVVPKISYSSGLQPLPLCPPVECRPIPTLKMTLSHHRSTLMADTSKQNDFSAFSAPSAVQKLLFWPIAKSHQPGIPEMPFQRTPQRLKLLRRNDLPPLQIKEGRFVQGDLSLQLQPGRDGNAALGVH